MIACLAVPTGAAASNSDALVLGDARSPVLQDLRRQTDIDITKAGAAKSDDPARYGMLIVDGDEMSATSIADSPLVSDFVSARRWVLALDVQRADLRAFSDYTGFDIGAGQERARAEMLAFRVGLQQGSPLIEIVDAGPLTTKDDGDLSEARQAELRRIAIRRATTLATDRTGLDPVTAGGAARADATNRSACPPLNPAPEPDLQHIGWCYTDSSQAAPPHGFWTKDEKRGWIDSYSVGQQTATWTVNHRFDVFLSNDPAHPKGNFQTIAYSENGQFAPKRPNENFFHMYDKFSSGWHGSRHVERAWWTGRIDPAITPDQATSKELTWQGSHPESANSETSYSSGEEFSVGFTGAKPDGGLGVNLSASFSNSKSYSIPDWGVENKTAGNDLRWTFAARHPCDTRDGQDRKSCFDTQFGFVGPYAPALPSELSRGNIQFNTSGRWRTKELLKPGSAPLKFWVEAPVTLVDTYCDGAFLGGWCGLPYWEYKTAKSGPSAFTAEVNADWVDPIEIDKLSLSSNKADGSKDQKVTGTITLKRKTKVPVNIRVFSDSFNAKLDAPLPGVNGGSQTTVTIPADSTTGTFTIRTNDNNLKAGEHTTASINAFFTESAEPQSLRIERP